MAYMSYGLKVRLGEGPVTGFRGTFKEYIMTLVQGSYVDINGYLYILG